MIRVNLISVTPGQSAPREWLPKEQRSAALGLVLLLGTAVLITSWWFYLHHERLTIEHNIVLAETELVRLKDVAQTVDRARTRKAELADRLDLIERLRATMRAPMRLLETVSHSVPHGLWLLEIKQVGTSVQIEGRAMSLTPVTDFAKQMQDSGFFKMPVDIISTNAEILEEVPVIHFIFKADVVVAAPGAAKATPVATNEPAPVAVPSPSLPPAPSTANAATSPANAETAGYQPAPPKTPMPAGPPKTDGGTVRSSGGR